MSDSALAPQVRRILSEIVGPQHLLEDADLRRSFERDWTGRWSGQSPAVIRPGTVGEIAEVVGLCAAEGIALVPQGGNTGLVGGGVPVDGELVLSTRRLSDISVAAQLPLAEVGAGASLERLQAAAAATGLRYGVDLAARGSATVGGTVATNAGGVHVLRWGSTRTQLLGVEAVLGDGSVISHLAGLAKDNTGYDLSGLLCGSEGTLGIVTRATLRLVPDFGDRVVTLVGFDDARAAIAASTEIARIGGPVEAIEVMTAEGLHLVRTSAGLEDPFDRAVGAVLLVEVATDGDALAWTSEAVGSLEGVVASVVATTAAGRTRLWQFRERHTEAIATLGPAVKLDVSLPLEALADFIERAPALVAEHAPDARTWLFGHAGDGNVHVNVTGLVGEEIEQITDVILRTVVAADGSISAEHGIGRAKRRWLPLQRSPAELAAFTGIKRALDPAGILNPHVLL